MVVEKGYKQTEVGVIPEEWEVKSVDEVFDFYSTANYSKAQMHLENEVGCLHYGLIHAIPNSYYNLRNGIKYFITQQQAKYEYLKDGDIVMVDASEDLTGVNKSVEVHGIDGKKFISGLHTFLLRDKGYYTSYIRGAILNSEIVKNQMLRLAVGMKVFGVSKPQLKTVLIPIPTLNEQTAIANALSDMDALIAQTSTLIEKKKAIKQGVMQELLKPKEGWVTKKFTDVVNYIHGKAHEQFIVDDGDYEVVNSKFISSNGNVKKYSNHSFLSARIGDVLTVLSDLPNGKALAKCFFVESNNKYAVNQRVCIWRSLGAYPKFLFYILNRHPFFLSLDDGVSQTHILNSHIEKFYLTIPDDVNEQKSIADTIWDIDKNISAIENKLQKLKLQKQGMVQALLTGKIRLV
jgi:type I restriction enzyme S subunit